MIQRFLLITALIVLVLPGAATTFAAPPAPVRQPLLGGDPAPVLAGERVMRTYSLDFYRLAGGMDAQTIQALAPRVEEAIGVAAGKLGGGWLGGRVSVRFEPPQKGPCAVRGLTFSHERTIRLFYAPDTNPQTVVAIMAHELVHQLQHDLYGWPAHRRADVILLEGMAVWASSDYFRDAQGRPLYDVRARQALAEGSIAPLTTSLEADCRTTTRNNMYNQWASFVEYLMQTYGREKLDQLYISSSGRPAGSADYHKVYGKSLDQLELDWLAWLQRKP